MKTNRIHNLGIAILAFTAFAGVSTEAMAQRTRIRVQLTNVGANILAKANAKFEERSDRLKFDVEGEDLTAAFSGVNVFVNGEFIASATVNALGRFSVDLDSRDGDTVPQIVQLDVIDVFDVATGALLFTGEMRSDTGGGQAQRARMRTRLTRVDANPLAKAVVKYEARLARRKFDVNGEDLGVEVSSVNVFVNGAFVANATVNEFGRFQVDLDTRKGATIPVVLEGDIVDVYDADAGTHLFTGQMAPRSL